MVFWKEGSLERMGKCPLEIFKFAFKRKAFGTPVKGPSWKEFPYGNEFSHGTTSKVMNRTPHRNSMSAKGSLHPNLWARYVR